MFWSDIMNWCTWKDMTLRGGFLAISVLLVGLSPTGSAANEIVPTTDIRSRYTWMLPKTVLDATVAYTLVGCDESDAGAKLKLKIAPLAIVPSYVPDTTVGLKSLDPALLKSFWQDTTILVTTAPNSHILASLSSNPINQVATIVGNVITGVTKLTAASLGVVPAAAPLAPVSKCGAAKNDLDNLKQLRVAQKQTQDALRRTQTQLALAEQNVASDPTKNPPVDPKDDEAKVTALTKDIATLQSNATALQTSISALQTSLTITMQRTIDPGVTPLYLVDDPAVWVPRKPFPIGPDGLIARFSPFLSMKKLKDANWFDDADLAAREDDKDIHVNIYLDFPKAYPRVLRCRACSVYATRVPANYQFRQVTFIPVTAYQGDNKDRLAPQDGIDRSLIASPAKATPFAQFGRAQALPLNAKLFENLKWAISFADSGQITSANFESKSIGAQITSLFMGASSGAASVATEVRNAGNTASSETQRLSNDNTALQAQINNITLNQQLQGLIAKGLAPSP